MLEISSCTNEQKTEFDERLKCVHVFTLQLASYERHAHFSYHSFGICEPFVFTKQRIFQESKKRVKKRKIRKKGVPPFWLRDGRSIHIQCFEARLIFLKYDGENVCYYSFFFSKFKKQPNIVFAIFTNIENDLRIFEYV